MDDSRAMCSGQRVPDLHSVCKRLVQRQGTSQQPAFERLALYIFHHEEIDVPLATDVMKRADMRMIRRGYGLGFAPESAPAVGVALDLVGEHLDRDRSAEARVLRAVHRTHATGPGRAENLVRAKSCPWSKSHRCSYESSVMGLPSGARKRGDVASADGSVCGRSN